MTLYVNICVLCVLAVLGKCGRSELDSADQSTPLEHRHEYSRRLNPISAVESEEAFHWRQVDCVLETTQILFHRCLKGIARPSPFLGAHCGDTAVAI